MNRLTHGPGCEKAPTIWAIRSYIFRSYRRKHLLSGPSDLTGKMQSDLTFLCCVQVYRFSSCAWKKLLVFDFFTFIASTFTMSHAWLDYYLLLLLFFVIGFFVTPCPREVQYNWGNSSESKGSSGSFENNMATARNCSFETNQKTAVL